MAQFHFRGPLPPQSRLFVGRQDELSLARRLCLGPVRSYITLVGGRQTGKTSFLYRLQSALEPRARCALINLRTVSGTALPDLFRFVATEIVSQLDMADIESLAVQVDSGPGLERLLCKLPRPGQNIAVLIDEIGTLPPSAAIYLANVLRAVFSNRLRARSPELARYVFLLAGGRELLNLGITETSPFSSVSTKILLPDLTLSESKQLMAYGYSGADMRAGLVHELAEATYEQVHGHPYLTQRIGAYLFEALDSDGEGLSHSGVCEAINRVLQDDDNLGHVRAILEDPAMLHTAFQILRHPAPFRHLGLRQKQLHLLGIIRDERGLATPRNAQYAQLICRLAEEAGVTRQKVVKQRTSPVVSVKLLTRLVPTAFCHNLMADDFPLIEIDVDNQAEGSGPAQVYAQASIEGFSDAAVSSASVAESESKRITLLPVLQQGPCKALTEIRPATLRVTVRQFGNGAEWLLHDQTYPVKLHAFDTALLGIRRPSDGIIDLTDYLCAFVTPHAPEVEQLLRKALDHHPQRQITGYQGAASIEEGQRIAREQVNAIYTALKEDAGLAYINSPLNFGKQEAQITQRVRLPSTSLFADRGRANCIDGTVLYASLIELANLQPLLIIVPGHAFVGWRLWRDVDQFDFLETTLTGADGFENALGAGREQYEEALHRGYFGRELFDPAGFARLVDVAACRAKGIYPLL